MSRRLTPAVGLAAWAAAALWLPPAFAQEAAAPAPVELSIGYVDLAEDPGFDPMLAYFQVPPTRWGRPIDGAELGILDAEQIGKVINVQFGLREHAGESAEDLTEVVRAWVAEGVHFVLVDLPADQLVALSDAVADLPVTLFNVTAQDDVLRGEQCRFNIVHTIPSYQMQTDALVQYLVFKNWKDILVLQGPEAEDEAIVAALSQSARFFGANVLEVRPFVLGADPRQREENNAALVTAGSDHDVVFVADSIGEFARNVPYRTNAPSLVVGSAGLTAEAWHWSWERQGAPQVNDRFEDLNDNRRMHSFDWAAWAAMRAVTQAVLRSQSTEHGPVLEYMLGERLNLDGSKGNPMSVRPWDHQLRQGILLATGNSVAELAPLQGFLHETNDLDTLGVDAPRTTCQFQP